MNSKNNSGRTLSEKEVIWQLKKYYTEEYRRLRTADFKGIKDTERNRMALQKAAKKCMGLEADPKDWVKAMFMYHEGSQPPWLYKLHAEQLEYDYKNYMKTNSRTITNGLGETRRATEEEFRIVAEMGRLRVILANRHKVTRITDEALDKTIMNPLYHFNPVAVFACAEADCHAATMDFVRPDAFAYMQEDPTYVDACVSLGICRELLNVEVL